MVTNAREPSLQESRYHADKTVLLRTPFLGGSWKKRGLQLTVHIHFLMRRSEYFKEALGPIVKGWETWDGHNTPVLDLPDEEGSEIAIQHYVDHVYSDKFSADAFAGDCDGTFFEKPDEHYELLAELYVLSNRMRDMQFRQAIIEEIVRLVTLTDVDGKRYFLSGDAASTIWRRGGRGARELVVELYFSYAPAEGLDQNIDGAVAGAVAQGFCEAVKKYGSVGEFRFRTLIASEYLVNSPVKPSSRKS